MGRQIKTWGSQDGAESWRGSYRGKCDWLRLSDSLYFSMKIEIVGTC
jgi:hypothetical protein